LTLLFLFSLASLVFSAGVVFKLSKGNGLLISPFALYWFLFVIFIVIGSVLLLIEPNFRLHFLSVRNLEMSLFRHAFDMNLSLVTFSLGGIAASKLWSFSASKEITDFQSFRVEGLNKTSVVYFWIAGAVCVLLLGTYFLTSDSVPIVQAIINILAGNESELAQLRRDATYENAVPGLLLQISRYVLPALVVCLGIFMFKLKFRSKVAWTVFALLALMSAFFLLIRGERSPIINVVLIFIVAQSLFATDSGMLRILKAMGVAVATVFFALSFLLGRVQSGEDWLDTIGGLLSELSYRVFVSQSQTGSYIYQLIPEVRDHYGLGLYWQNLVTFLPGTQRSFSVDLFEMVHGFSGSASHSAIAEGFAAMGSVFASLLSFLVGFIFMSLSILLVRSRKSVISILFLSVMIPSLASIATGSITGIIYGGGAAAIIAYIGMYLMMRVGDAFKSY